jgi:hypothetical protein
MGKTQDPTDEKEEKTGKEIRINKESIPNCDGCCGGCNWPEHD